MRRVWSDIDHARDTLGLGPVAAVPATTWTLGGVVASASATIGAIAAGATDVLRSLIGAIPDPLKLIATAVPCVRRVPLVGALFE